MIIKILPQLRSVWIAGIGAVTSDDDPVDVSDDVAARIVAAGQAVVAVDDAAAGYIEESAPENTATTRMTTLEESIELQTRALTELNSVSERTAALLRDAGILTVNELALKSVSDLQKIEGISKKQARKIKQEIEKMI
jgi:predicted flap endonuclease-1-like 5' DNA nuclease